MDVLDRCKAMVEGLWIMTEKRQEGARTGVGRSILDVDGWICIDD
jgi:hypothetical protein